MPPRPTTVIVNRHRPVRRARTLPAASPHTLLLAGRTDPHTLASDAADTAAWFRTRVMRTERPTRNVSGDRFVPTNVVVVVVVVVVGVVGAVGVVVVVVGAVVGAVGIARSIDTVSSPVPRTRVT